MALSAFENALLAKAPVSLWLLNDASGPAASDYIGANPGAYGGTFALHQPAIAPGGAFSAKFTGGFMAEGFAPPSFPAPITFWLQLQSLTQASDGWMFRTGVPGTNGWGLFIPAGTSQPITYGLPSGNTSLGFSVPDLLPHWYAFFTAASGTTNLYVDGIQRFGGNLPGPVAPTTGFGFAAAHNGTLPLNCYMEDIALFNYGITPSEILSLYAAAVPTTPIVPPGGSPSLTDLELKLDTIIGAVQKTFPTT